MNNLAIQKKILFHNLVLFKDTGIVLLNLFSFRRAFISLEDYWQLWRTANKLSSGGKIDESDSVYLLLCEKKQILNDDVIRAVDDANKEQMLRTTGKVNEILINLTYACNLNCKYCYQKEHKSRVGHIAPSDVKKIRQYLNCFNNGADDVEQVTISGGEPLLPQNIATIQTILDKFDGCRFKLFTNGINILKYIDEIDYSKISEFQISLDGMESTIQTISDMPHLKVYENIIEGIRYLSELGCNISLVSIMSPGMSGWLNEFLNDLQNRGVFSGKVHLRISIPLVPGSKNVVDKDYFSMEEYLRIRSILKDGKWYRNVRLDVPTGFSKIQAKLFRGINERVTGVVQRCKTWERTPLTFGPNGTVNWCNCVHPDGGVLGNYYTGDVDRKLLEELRNRSVFTIEKCRQCDMRYLCGGGCPCDLFARGKNNFSPACCEYDCDELVKEMERFLYEDVSLHC